MLRLATNEIHGAVVAGKPCCPPPSRASPSSSRASPLPPPASRLPTEPHRLVVGRPLPCLSFFLLFPNLPSTLSLLQVNPIVVDFEAPAVSPVASCYRYLCSGLASAGQVRSPPRPPVGHRPFAPSRRGHGAAALAWPPTGTPRWLVASWPARTVTTEHCAWGRG
ncbi:hypothetical protein ZWY2020_008227 [Hordeum vulgare]|nr:hypothetical protein ZWY2020_008227 [Hordeum vulgare]